MKLIVRNSLRDPTKQDVFETDSLYGEARIASYQKAWDTEMTQQRENNLDPNEVQVYLQYRPCSDVYADILTVEFPDTRCSYLFRTHSGVAQWYFTPQAGFNAERDLPKGRRRIDHDFFGTLLAPISTSIFNGLCALLTLREAESICEDILPKHVHYMLRIRVGHFGDYTMHYVCSNVGFDHFFDTLCGKRLAPRTCLSTMVGGFKICFFHEYESEFHRISDIPWPGHGGKVVMEPIPDSYSSYKG